MTADTCRAGLHDLSQPGAARVSPSTGRRRCRACAAAYQAAYYPAWRAANGEQVRAAHAEYYATNVERIAARAAAYRQANVERERARIAAHTARRRGCSDVRTVTLRDGRRLLAAGCADCQATEDLALDHLIPIKRGGAHQAGNLTARCRTCNGRKGSRPPIEWRLLLARQAAA